MTPRELLDAFDVLAEAPNGVARLRELVLQLAVRGRLVPQDPSDEPAIRILERVAKEKARLLSSGKISKPKPVAKIEHEPFQLPGGWTWARLASLVAWDLTDGDWVESKDQSPGGGVRLTQLADIGVGRFLDKSARFLTSETAARLRCTYLEEGDVLIARLPRPLGRACEFPGLPQPAVTVVDVAIARCSGSSISAPYLVHCMNSLFMQQQVLDKAAGTTRSRVSTGNLRQMLVPLAPIAEQARIVARVDELMALIDRFEQARLRRESARVAFRDASLAELRDSETAEELGYAWQRISDRLESMLTSGEDASGLRDSVLELAATGRLPDRGSVAGKAAEGPCSLPEGWRWARLGDVLKEGPTNGWSPQAVEHVTNIKTLKLSATTRGEFDGSYFKYVDAPAEAVEKFWLEPDDILIQRSNTPEYVGIAARFDGPHRTFIYPDLMMRCRVTADVLPSFVHLCLNAPYNRTWFRARASGTSQSMVKLNQANVRSAWIPVPPLDVQRDIVASVGRFGSLVDSVAQAAQRASNTAARIASAFADRSSWDSPQG